VTSLLLNIHPRVPVAPSVQSWFAPAGILSPRVKFKLATCEGTPVASGGATKKEKDAITATDVTNRSFTIMTTS